MISIQLTSPTWRSQKEYEALLAKAARVDLYDLEHHSNTSMDYEYRCTEKFEESLFSLVELIIDSFFISYLVTFVV